MFVGESAPLVLRVHHSNIPLSPSRARVAPDFSVSGWGSTPWESTVLHDLAHHALMVWGATVGEGTFLTAAEIGRILGIDPKTVLRSKELRSFSYDLGHRIVRWKVTEFEDYLRRKRGGQGSANEGVGKRVIPFQSRVPRHRDEGRPDHEGERGDGGVGVTKGSA